MITAVAMLAAAAATAWSTYLHWLPCRGTLLNGSFLRGYAYGPDFSDGCLRRMDTGLPFPSPPEPAEQAPWASELGVVAMTLVGVAWIGLVLGMRWSRRTTVVAVLPGLATWALAAVAAVASVDAGRSPDDGPSRWLWLAPEAGALVALWAIWSWQTELRGRGFSRLLVAVWGTTAFGLFHEEAEYTVMIASSDANWDTPPLTGFLTVTVLAVAAVGIAVMTFRSSPRRYRAPG